LQGIREELAVHENIRRPFSHRGAAGNAISYTANRFSVYEHVWRARRCYSVMTVWSTAMSIPRISKSMHRQTIHEDVRGPLNVRSWWESGAMPRTLITKPHDRWHTSPHFLNGTKVMQNCKNCKIASPRLLTGSSLFLKPLASCCHLLLSARHL